MKTTITDNKAAKESGLEGLRLCDENKILVSADEYDWLIEKLNEPPQEIPALRRLLNRKPIWER